MKLNEIKGLEMKIFNPFFFCRDDSSLRDVVCLTSMIEVAMREVVVDFMIKGQRIGQQMRF